VGHRANNTEIAMTARTPTRSKLAIAALLSALGAAQAAPTDVVTWTDPDAQAAASDVVWVDNDSFGFASCPGSDELPGSTDPQELMRALRERGLLDARQTLRVRGLVTSTVTLTPVSADARCDSGAPSMVFRLSAVDRATGQAWTSNLVSVLPNKIQMARASVR
jgi:hypothetical protein